MKGSPSHPGILRFVALASDVLLSTPSSGIVSVDCLGLGLVAPESVH